MKNIKDPPEKKLELWERAIESVNNGVIITDARVEDNPIVYVNPAFEGITGYKKSEIIGKNCRFLQGDEHDQPGIQKLRQAIKNEEPCQVVIRNYRKDGTMFHNQLSIAPIRDEDNQLTHFVGVQVDLTDMKRAEEAEYQSKKKSKRIRELEEHLEALEKFMEAPTKVSSDLYSGQTFAQRMPDESKRLTGYFEEVLDNTIDERTFKVESEASDKLKELAAKLCRYMAGPRDVIELYKTVLKSKLNEATPRQSKVYVDEGRILVLELLGYMTSQYRKHAIGYELRQGKSK